MCQVKLTILLIRGTQERLEPRGVCHQKSWLHTFYWWKNCVMISHFYD